ncbi:hypothetical protein [Pseudomonas putida]|nr:hypothetical protein [Pseudomonas putida]
MPKVKAVIALWQFFGSLGSIRDFYDLRAASSAGVLLTIAKNFIVQPLL